MRLHAHVTLYEFTEMMRKALEQHFGEEVLAVTVESYGKPKIQLTYDEVGGCVVDTVEMRHRCGAPT